MVNANRLIASLTRMLKSADSETIRDLEDAVDIDVSRGNLGMSSAFRDSADRFQTRVGPEQQMSGGRDGASKFVSDYSHDASNATRGGLTESYDSVADRLERQVGVMASMILQNHYDTKKAIAELAAYVLGVPLKKDRKHDDEDGEIAEESNFAGSGGGASEHETDESTASEERKDSSKRQRKARKSESLSEDSGEEAADNADEESAIKSMTVESLFSYVSRGKLSPAPDSRKAMPFQNPTHMPVRQPPNLAQSYGTSRRRIIKSRALIEAALAELPPEYAIQYETHLQRQAAMARGLIDDRALAQTQPAFDEVQRLAAAYAEE